MSIGEQIGLVNESLKKGEALIDKARNPPGPLQDEGMNGMATKHTGFDPGEHTKALIAALGTFGSQWGINFNEAINQVVLNPPENMGQALILTTIVSGAVWYFKNRKS